MASNAECQQVASRVAHRAIVVAYGCGLASFGLTWAQARWHVFHPHYLPLILLFVGLAASTVVALACCLWRIVRGPHRFRALTLAGACLVPAGLWATIGMIAQRNHRDRWVPDTVVMRLAKVMGACFIRAEAEIEYPHRLETDRLVMHYNDVERPAEDLQAMDRFLASLEQELGGTLPAKVYWIRGSMPRIGVGWLSVHGLSLGSDSSPEIAGEYRGDRHELAHAALDAFRSPTSDPPCVLHEGWAMSQCGDSRKQLAQVAAAARSENPWIGLRELLEPNWYYRDSGPVYSLGGAFVEFLIRTRGTAKFRRFALECTPSTVELRCHAIFGTSLEELETEFWKDLDASLELADTPSSIP